MKSKLLTALVGFFPSYLTLYASSFQEAITSFCFFSVVGALLMLTNEPPSRCASEEEISDYKRRISVGRDLWICHFIGYAIVLFIKSL